MRLFVAAWPPPAVVDVVDAVAAAARRAGPEDPAGLADGPRWVGPERWHVTLRFLGAVDEEAVPAVQAALTALAWPAEDVVATLRATTACLGRSVLVAPVDGLAPLAAAVVEATAGFGEPPEDRPFRGHVTLARAGGRGRGRRGGDLRPWAGVAAPAPAPVTAVAWPVAEVALVRSAGGRYQTLSRHPRTNARSKLRSRQ